MVKRMVSTDLTSSSVRDDRSCSACRLFDFDSAVSTLVKIEGDHPPAVTTNHCGTEPRVLQCAMQIAC